MPLVPPQPERVALHQLDPTLAALAEEARADSPAVFDFVVTIFRHSAAKAGVAEEAAQRSFDADVAAGLSWSMVGASASIVGSSE